MPRLQAEATVTTKTEVDLSLALQKKLKLGLKEFSDLCEERTKLDEKIAAKKNSLETLFADSDEYEALSEGVRVSTPMGEIPMKIVKGFTAGKLNLKKLMTKFKLTPKDIDSCKDKPKPKKEYLGIWLPKDKEKDSSEGEE